MVALMNDQRGLEAHIVLRRSEQFTLDVSLTIDAGETIALVGPNGAGKSTLVDVLAGLLPLDSGAIHLGGRVLDDVANGVFVPPEQRRIGVVFQDYLLFDHLSVVDNVAFGPSSSGRRRREARRAADRWIEAFDLADLRNRRPPELSGGQAQRVALARALASEPDLLLLDEPLSALDVETRSELRRTLAEHLGDYPGPRLLITHDPTDAFLLADRIFVLEDGAVSQAATPDEIRRRPATRYAAALAGTNLLTGTNKGGSLTIDGSTQPLQTADAHTEGRVLVTIHPTAIALHQRQPHGSPRNSWQTTIDTVEPLGETTRITLAQPIPLGVDITPAATAALNLVPGSPVWASVKATEIAVHTA